MDIFQIDVELNPNDPEAIRFYGSVSQPEHRRTLTVTVLPASLASHTRTFIVTTTTTGRVVARGTLEPHGVAVDTFHILARAREPVRDLLTRAFTTACIRS